MHLLFFLTRIFLEFFRLQMSDTRLLSIYSPNPDMIFRRLQNKYCLGLKLVLWKNEISSMNKLMQQWETVSSWRQAVLGFAVHCITQAIQRMRIISHWTENKSMLNGTWALLILENDNKPKLNGPPAFFLLKWN